MEKFTSAMKKITSVMEDITSVKKEITSVMEIISTWRILSVPHSKSGIVPMSSLSGVG